MASGRTRALAGGSSASLSSAVSRPAATIWPAALRLAGDQVELLEAGQHLGLVAAEHRRHTGGLDARRPWPSRRRGWRPARRRRRRRSRRRSRMRRSRRRSARPPPALRPASRPRLVSSSWASRVAATTSGWVTAVSVISSAVAVVPSRARSRPLNCDQAAIRSAAPGQLKPRRRACRGSGNPVREQAMQAPFRAHD